MIAKHAIGREVVFEIGTDGITVRDLEVIGLDPAFDDQFPIGLDLDGLVRSNKHVLDLERVQFGAEPAEEALHIRRPIAFCAHPDKAVAFLAGQPFEAVVALFFAGKPFFEMGRSEEFACA